MTQPLISPQLFLNMMNKKILFNHLDKLRKDSPAEYAEFVEKHENDLRTTGYFDN